MNLPLDLLDASNPPAIQSHALLVLITALLDTPRNTRAFEEADGLLCISSIFKDRRTTHEVRTRALEFLYFYLLPEVPSLPNSASQTAVLERASSKEYEQGARHRHTYSEDGGGGGGGGDMEIDEADDRRSVSSKQALLSRHITKLPQMMADLKTTAPLSLLASRS